MKDIEYQDVESIATLPYKWEKLSGKSILISGGSGFIGTFISNVIRYRNEKYNAGIKVISLSRSSGVSDSTVEHLKMNIVNPISYTEPVDYILHLASNTHPKQYGEDPVGTIITNVYGCNNLLKLAVEKKSRFIFASSVEIYGQGTADLMSEDYCGYINCNVARNGYNESKRVCEALCQSYKNQYGVNVVIARLARVFGADSKADTKAMSQFMQKAVFDENIILKSTGKQRFSYCYIADAVSGILKIMLDGQDGEAYNVSDDDESLNLGDYADFIATLAGKSVQYQIEDNASVSCASYALVDTAKLKELGWEPLFTVKEGLERTYKIYKNRTHVNEVL